MKMIKEASLSGRSLPLRKEAFRLKTKAPGGYGGNDGDVHYCHGRTMNSTFNSIEWFLLCQDKHLIIFFF